MKSLTLKELISAIESATGLAIVRASNDLTASFSGAEGVRFKEKISVLGDDPSTPWVSSSDTVPSVKNVLLWIQGESPDGSLTYETMPGIIRSAMANVFETWNIPFNVTVSPVWTGSNWDKWIRDPTGGVEHVFWTKSTDSAWHDPSRDPYMSQFKRHIQTQGEHDPNHSPDDQIMTIQSGNSLGTMVALDKWPTEEKLVYAAEQFARRIMAMDSPVYSGMPVPVSRLLRAFHAKKQYPAYWAEPTSDGYMMYGLQSPRISTIPADSFKPIIYATGIYRGQAPCCTKLIQLLNEVGLPRSARLIREFQLKEMPRASLIGKTTKLDFYLLGAGNVMVPLSIAVPSDVEHDFLYLKCSRGLVPVVPDVPGVYYNIGPAYANAGIGVQCGITLAMAASNRGRSLQDKIIRSLHTPEPSGHVVQSINLSPCLFMCFLYENMGWNAITHKSAYGIRFAERDTGLYHTSEEYGNGALFALNHVAETKSERARLMLIHHLVLAIRALTTPVSRTFVYY